MGGAQQWRWHGAEGPGEGPVGDGAEEGIGLEGCAEALGGGAVKDETDDEAPEPEGLREHQRGGRGLSGRPFCGGGFFCVKNPHTNPTSLDDPPGASAFNYNWIKIGLRSK